MLPPSKGFGYNLTVPPRYRFGRFVLDPSSGELQRDGVAVHLQDQPLQVLLLLIRRAGDVVSRDEVRRQVWRDDTFVDFDQGLNSIVKRLREVLGDAADRPVFIETVPRRGYRFLVRAEELPSVTTAGSGPADSAPSAGPPTGRRRGAATLAAAAAVLIAAGLYGMRRPGGNAPANSPRAVRLAVLPFDNLTGNEDQQFFADGLHEEMIFRLGRTNARRLTVIARTSVMRYRDAPRELAAIGRELGVDFVLEGSVRQAGDRIRVAAQLIRAADQLHLWAETYDRRWSDLLAIQSDISARVADSLAVELLPSSEAAAAIPTVRPKAYEHYLRGRYYWNQRTRNPSAQLARAIEEFRLAIAEQPDYALAYAAMADSYNSIFFANPAVGDTPYAQARRALQESLRLDPALAPAYSTMGWMTLHFDRNLPEAQRSFERALALDSNDSVTRYRYAHLLAIRGRLPEAEREAEGAQRSDPLSAPIAAIRGWLAYYRGDAGAAVLRMKEAAELEGDATKLHAFSALLRAEAGDCAAATTALGPARLDIETLRLAESVFARARCADGPTLDELYQVLLMRRLTYSIAMFHLARRDSDAFYEWLNRAIDERFPEALYLGVDPVFSSERNDPRFRAALQRAGIGS